MTASMQSLVQEYLDERRRLGYALSVPGTQLMAFARFADRSGHRGPLTADLVLAWARGEATRATPITWARRLEIVRPFAQHRARIEPGTEVPDADVFGRGHRRLAPHIYTDAEIVDLLAAARRLPPEGMLRPTTYETLFGLIAATGLRLSEALHLCCSDLDLGQGHLTVRRTKFCKSRLVPLHPSTMDALTQYLAVRQRHVPPVPEAPLFVSLSGNGLPTSTVHHVFMRIRADLGWIARGGHPVPRIHDLRHTFICRRVMLWHEHGTDIDNAMLALSTYVGHVKVSDTYWYLSGVPELMGIAGQRFERFASPPGGAHHG
ncbi:tyrosine-type recombinase/integrase [Azospirillum thermophilum]|uniref:Integrase n=1 Tax=Azospirillum thermophilum TaxID=2202148 RepID=A0A2S2CNA7_9PROT|nr:tyrosine-type recombinase/integrase [Azospirillum thermophilum]AWK85972.1 integrase [Azospirillum thermophilum]